LVIILFAYGIVRNNGNHSVASLDGQLTLRLGTDNLNLPIALSSSLLRRVILHYFAR
jgi:hypothetical protein